MDHLEVVGNWVEAALWLGVSLIFLGLARKAEGPRRRIFLILTAAFFVFALSDVIETQTGAWWRPAWLLVIKGGCILVLFGCFRAYYRLTRKKDS
jgi:hypothetical protein